MNQPTNAQNAQTNGNGVTPSGANNSPVVQNEKQIIDIGDDRLNSRGLYLGIQDVDFNIKKSESTIDAIFRRTEELIILLATLVGLGFTLYYCVDTIQQNSSPDTTKWAQSTLTLIVGAGLGYMGGKKAKE